MGIAAMSRRNTIPSYRKHRQSGQAIVTLPDGLGRRHDVLLGIYGSQQSRTKYARVIAEWEANGRRLLQATVAGGLTVNELILAYWGHVVGYYVKDGKPTSEQDTIRQTLRFLRETHGDIRAEDFGPLSLKAVRQRMIEHDVTRKVRVKDSLTGEVSTVVKVIQHGLSRRHVNKQIGRIRRMFGWAVEEELLPASVHEALLRVTGLRKGKSVAREKPPVRPVRDADVEAVLPLVPPMVRTMIEVQGLSGARPQEIVEMRPVDIDMTGPIWEYRPRRYKTQHRNEEDSPDKERVVFLGPRAQSLIKPYLPLQATGYVFDPRRSEAERSGIRRNGRKTPLWPSHIHRQEGKRLKRRKSPLREHYDVASYRRAILRACEKAGVDQWSPNRLRHSRGTEIRKVYGIEGAQAVLGHSELGVTQVYAEVDRQAARKIMAEIG
jgi:integrase